MMPTSLTLDTVRSNDGILLLLDVWEIDLSNIDAFDRALTTATADAVLRRRQRITDQDIMPVALKQKWVNTAVARRPVRRWQAHS